jgi:hypothetical protein
MAATLEYQETRNGTVYVSGIFQKSALVSGVP